MTGSASVEQVARVVRRCLERGASVEIDGLGSFRKQPDGTLRFEPRKRPSVFIAYVVEDAASAERLYDDLAALGFDPWLDRRKLLAGQNWPRAIEHVIATADFFVACFSPRAAVKRGRFHAELRYALDCASEIPLDQVYFVPVRFGECRIPARVGRHYQWVDLFPDWDAGVQRLVTAMRSRMQQCA